MKLRKNKRYLDLPIKLENPGKRPHLLLFKKQYYDPANFIRYGVSFFKCKTESASATSSLGYSIVIGQKRLQPLSGLTPIRLRSAS